MASLIVSLVFTALASKALANTCQYTQVQQGDGCYSIEQRCGGISQAQLQQYNPDIGDCSSTDPDIVAGSYVCCSPGSPPNFGPQPYSNGTCYTYQVQPNDYCSTIATTYKISNWTSINTWNNETWGFTGCGDIQHGQNICLSPGTPPFPAPVANTTCGPQVPGTTQPAGMNPSNWTNLNPCPLNACCDIWGQCGITSDFCTKSESATGAPGTAAPLQNGCISNCGTNIVYSQTSVSAPWKRIGYFEAWNEQRPCLNMDVSKLSNDTTYTHIHWAFGNLTTSWEPDVSGLEDQFNGFVALNNVKRILSFGGWSFSTSAYTFQVFRSGILPANQQQFATNVVNFIVQNNLDGVDFDWEYPGEPDIPGIPAGSSDGGSNYLAFLKLVRAQLPSSKTLSIAAPASYWYLRAFPIAEISQVVSYIVYMTYDLHGQWDYGNTFADPGCPTGGCLRSHINETEVNYALAMITKAGVPTTKIVIGMPLYGRSFGMSDQSCTGPECHFTGPNSGATPGPCTQTAGYISNYEINEIIFGANSSLYGNYSIDQFYDTGDVLIYGDNYVSWMSPSTYNSRYNNYFLLGWAGTSDWAIDLNQTYSGNGTGTEQGFGQVNFTMCDFTVSYPDMETLSYFQGLNQWPAYCTPVYALGTLINMLNTTMKNYTSVDDGYAQEFGYYQQYVTDMVPEVLKADFFFNQTAADVTTTPMADSMAYFNCELQGGPTIPCMNLNQSQYSDQVLSGTTKMILTNNTGYQACLANAGLAPGWVTFGNYDYTIQGEGRGSTEVQYRFSGAPIQNSSMVVSNPQNIITQGLGNITQLMQDMLATYMDMGFGQWYNGSTVDPANAYSTAVFAYMSAVEGMAQAKQLGQQQQKTDEEEKKELILAIVGACLIVVPFIGEGAEAVSGVAELGLAVSIADGAANTALSIYSTVLDPSSAFVNIIGALFGIGGIVKAVRDGPGIAGIAEAKADMSADEVASLGDTFDNEDTTLSKIMGACK